MASTDNKSIFVSQSYDPQGDTFKVGTGMSRPLWDEEASKDLNTYRAYNSVILDSEPLMDGKTMAFPASGDKHLYGRHSLFNAVNAVGDNLKYQVELNAPLMDTPDMRDMIRQRSDCSVKALVDASARGEMGRAIYNYSDFMFCKHLGRISNNYLITLRRFPKPAGDHINYTLTGRGQEMNAHAPDIGRLVTWMGTPGNDMASILKYSVNLPYKEMKASIQDSQINADQSGGFLGGLMNMGSSSYTAGMLSGKTGQSGMKFIQDVSTKVGLGKLTGGLRAPDDTSWAYYRDQNKTYGPVDSITDTYYRQGAEDGGIKFEHNINLTFDYELRSFDGINTRAAFLDLLANILAVTFTNATYWGGAVRATGAAQSNAFANLPIFHMGPGDMTFAGLQDKVVQSLSQIGSHFNGGTPIKDLKDAMNALSNLAKGVFTGLTAGALNALGRPQKSALNSLINFAPTGLWHLMIGNPRHPIMSIGNMILKNCTLEHYGPLGLDDFPTGIKVTIELTHGTPRDNLRIEQMYMNGDFRVYHPMGKDTYDNWVKATEIGGGSEGSTHDMSQTVEGASTKDATTADPNGKATTTEEASSRIDATSKRLLKYFGTVDADDINMAGREGYLGSQPNKKPDSNKNKKGSNNSSGSSGK